MNPRDRGTKRWYGQNVKRVGFNSKLLNEHNLISWPVRCGPILCGIVSRRAREPAAETTRTSHDSRVLLLAGRCHGPIATLALDLSDRDNLCRELTSSRRSMRKIVLS